MRDSTGKFTLKNGEYRSVRSLRLTNSTWERLGELADEQGMTRADWIEELIQNSPSNTRQDSTSQPSNTRLVESAIALLTDALKLKANAGGQIKAAIRDAIALLHGIHGKTI